MNASQKRILSKFKKTVIKHPQFLNAYEKVVEAYELKKEIDFQVNLICIGMSGTGKSTLKRKVAERFPPYDTKDGRMIPVLVIDTPSLPTVKNVAEAMLFQFGDLAFYRGSAVEKTTRILHYIKICGVKLIIFDELQHFIDQGNKTAPKQVSDWLKTLIDQSGVSSVLMGLEQSEYILRVNEQLRRRFSRRIDLTPFAIAEERSFKNFASVLLHLYDEVEMPLTGEIDTDLFRRWHFATNGIMAHMVTLIIAAYQVAKQKRYEAIHLKCLEQAFTEAIWSEGVDKLNPFNRSFAFTRLTKPGMPFHTAKAREFQE